DCSTRATQPELDRADQLWSAKVKDKSDATLQIAQLRTPEVLQRPPARCHVAIVGKTHLVRILSLVLALGVEISRPGDGQPLELRWCTPERARLLSVRFNCPGWAPVQNDGGDEPRRDQRRRKH